MGLKEKEYISLRERLDRLGYVQPLSPDSVFLVDKLLADLDFLQRQFAHYKSQAVQANSKCCALEQAFIPYKKDNEHLIKENNELHRILIHERDEADKKIKEMKSQLLEIETAYTDLEFAYMEQMSNIDELHRDILSKKLESSPKEYTDKGHFSAPLNSSKSSPQKKSKEKQLQKKIKANLKTITSVNNYISNVLDKKSGAGEVNILDKLKKDNVQLLDTIELNKHQVQIRDGEIERLGKMLEKKSPIFVQHNETCNCHCFEDTDFPAAGDNDPVLLKKQLEEALEKQHQAMKKATDLMERIKILEAKFIRLEPNSRPKTCHCSTHDDGNQRAHFECLETLKCLESEKAYIREQLEKLKNENNILERNCTYLSTENQKLNEKLKQAIKDAENSNFAENKEAHISNPEKKTCTAEYKKECSCCCCEQKYSHQKESCSSDSETNEHRICSHKNVIKILNKEKKEANDELTKIQNQLADYKEKVAGLSHAKLNEKCNNEVIKLQLEDKIKSYELEKKSLTNKVNSISSKLENTERHLDKLRHEAEELTTECANWKAKYNHIKVLNEHLEMAIKSSEETEKTKEADIKTSVSRIQELENEKLSLENAFQAIQKERANLRNSIHHLDKEKDALMISLDEKAVQLSKMEGSMKQKNNYIAKLEQEISSLQAQLQTLERMLTSTENKARSSNNDIRKMEAEICTLESCKENLLYENRRLQNDLSALATDNMQMSGALEASKQEVENLKIRLQTYVEEVRRVDELLQIKENERAELLDQFKALSAEASNLEVNNQSLEYESTHAKKTLQQTTERLQNLEWEIESKNSIVKEMEGQVTGLTSQIHEMYSKMSEKDNYESALASDLDAARNLCSSLEKQKQMFNEQIWELQQNETTLKTDLDKIRKDNEHLVQRINEESKNKQTLEDVLASSRQEAMEKSLYSRDLRSEVGEMQQNVRSLENKLDQLTRTLQDCQKSCEDYREENIRLKRELTNEKFERTRAEDSLSFSTSL